MTCLPPWLDPGVRLLWGDDVHDDRAAIRDLLQGRDVYDMRAGMFIAAPTLKDLPPGRYRLQPDHSLF